MKGIVLHSVVPVRSEANEGSEQLTQLLFAETVDILTPTIYLYPYFYYLVIVCFL